MKSASPPYCAKANDWIKGIDSLALSRFNVVKKMLATLIYANSARHYRQRAEQRLPGCLCGMGSCVPQKSESKAGILSENKQVRTLWMGGVFRGKNFF